MKKSLIIMFVFLLVLTPVVFAFEINIKTLPNHRVSLFVRNAGQLTTLESFHKDTGTGELSISSSVSSSEVDLLVQLKQDGVRLINHKFEAVSTSEPIDLYLMLNDIKIGFDEPVVEEPLPEPVEEVVEEVVEALVEEVVEEATQESVDEDGGENWEAIKNFFKSKTFYYILGGIGVVLLLFVIFFVLKLVFKNRGAKELQFNASHFDEDIDEAERRIDIARRQLEELKSKKTKIKDAKERLKRDERELAKLERLEKKS